MGALTRTATLPEIDRAATSRTLEPSDAIIESLTGLEPTRFHPAAYEIANLAVNEQHGYYRQTEGRPLTAEEAAMVKLSVLCSVMSRQSEWQHQHRMLGQAIKTLRALAKDKIRATISMKTSWQTGF